MIFFAGDRLAAADLNALLGDVGNTDITTDATASSGSVETATGVTVTANLISGEQYWVELFCNVSFDATLIATPQLILVRLREDSLTGTQMQVGQFYPSGSNATSIGFPLAIAARYTAVATAAKTFAVTIQRAAGSGGVAQVRAGTGRNGMLRVRRKLTFG